MEVNTEFQRVVLKKKRVLSFGSIELQVEGAKINLYHILKIFNYKKRHQKENGFFESAKPFPISIHSHENVTARYPGYPKKRTALTGNNE